jgi:tetratricopeptide (TPR) repeat protein
MIIYLSSTYSDLRAEREAVYRALHRLRSHHVRAMEDYVAADARPLDACLDDVRGCDIYVGLLGWRYGYIPPGAERSITELEFREARARGKTCLIFMRDESTRPADLAGADAQRALALRQELGRDFLASFFVSPDDLAAKATAAVANQMAALTEAIGRLDMPLAQVLERVRQLGELPRLTLPEIELEAQHLQADAMNWLVQSDGLASAQRRLQEARRLVAVDGLPQAPESAALLTLLGYIEKTQWQISESSGDAVRAQESFAQATRYFNAARAIEPGNLGALNGQANLFIATRDFDRAIEIGRYVTALGPTYGAAFWDLGIALNGKLERDGPDADLLDELADVYEVLVELIPRQPGGFTPADLEYARDAAKRYRQAHARQAKTPTRHSLRRNRAVSSKRNG